MRGLGKKYDGLYDGNLIESEIEKLSLWKNRETPPHMSWVSTRTVATTGEAFGLIDSVHQTNQNDGYNSDANLECESANVVEQLLELETGKFV